ncbi:unnamed protein product [Prunus armeniaca]
MKFEHHKACIGVVLCDTIGVLAAGLACSIAADSTIEVATGYFGRLASGSSIQVYAISEIPALTFGNVIGHWSLGLQIGSGSLNQVSIVEDEPLYLGQPTPSSLIGILDKDGLPCPLNHST